MNFKTIIGPSFILLSLTLLFSCKEPSKEVDKITGKQIPVNRSLDNDTQIEAFVSPYRKNLNSHLDSVLCYSPKNMDKKEGELETTIGNMMADIIVNEADPIFNKRTGKNIDFCLLNHGGIRAPIAKGDVTMRTAYEVMPFENAIVVAELSGAKIKELLTYLVSRKRAHPISSGLRITLNKDYSLQSAIIKGKAFDDTKTYFVATSDYLQHGGDSMNFFKDPIQLTTVDYKIRNALIDHFAKVDTLPAILDGRFKILK